MFLCEAKDIRFGNTLSEFLEWFNAKKQNLNLKTQKYN